MSASHWDLHSTEAETRRKNKPVIDHLQQKLAESLAKVLPHGGGYAILDYPNHSNIGDSAIYLGETVLCRKHFGRDPNLVIEANIADLDRVARLDPSLPLLLHGGGNFGDLYPRHQQFREAVLNRFPERKVVLFPQSIHFEDKENIAASAMAINSHPDFTMMVRDHVSFAFAQKHFDCEVLLVPDMAFMIGAITPKILPNLSILGLIRRDKESVLLNSPSFSGLPKPFEIVDWPLETSSRRIVERLPRIVRKLFPPQLQGVRPATPAAYEWLARKRVETGVATLSQGRIVLTDRLHAHILSLLLGKPHIVLDNSYRKIANFADAWTDTGGFLRAEGLVDALALIKRR